MDVNNSICIHCKEKIHYSEARLLPGGGGVCLKCASKLGYRTCDECQDCFIPAGEEEHFCDICLRRIFEQFV
jgi:hypothetical protein